MAERQFDLQNTSKEKYGLRKIFKADFNTNPSRYRLRKGFPDAPLCPYGNHFSALGYDVQEKEYVWLVSGILKDERLAVEETKPIE